ncbi:hypothetical protein TrLO_g14407 [Triparma laevis f. longispina]|uniref:MYND-type domain-containing protein n=1 Tax=Triparma laevis f. longispina TaxID=1714387 RepID=A0A9W6ZEY1_9STRA|nr:hypothetical protein TrLO_g14407 [Triparma laevis f. longispina]
MKSSQSPSEPAAAISTCATRPAPCCDYPGCASPAPLKCSRCLNNHYCSVAHQAAHWKLHKSHCVPTPPSPQLLQFTAESTPTSLNYANLTHFTTAFPTLQSTLSTFPDLLSQSFSAIFATTPSTWKYAQELSREARGVEKGGGGSALGYGEILPETVFEIMEVIRREYGVVYDLGSGSGRVLFASCLSHPFTSAYGLEYLPTLHENALHNLNLWRTNEEEAHCNSTPPRIEFVFTCGDITKIPNFKLTPNPTLLLCHATLFDKDLFACVQLTCENCDPGTTFVMVTKELRTGYVTGIETLGCRQYEMSWGWATIYIQRRV